MGCSFFRGKIKLCRSAAVSAKKEMINELKTQKYVRQDDRERGYMYRGHSGDKKEEAGALQAEGCTSPEKLCYRLGRLRSRRPQSAATARPPSPSELLQSDSAAIRALRDRLTGTLLKLFRCQLTDCSLETLQLEHQETSSVSDPLPFLMSKGCFAQTTIKAFSLLLLAASSHLWPCLQTSVCEVHGNTNEALNSFTCSNPGRLLLIHTSSKARSNIRVCNQSCLWPHAAPAIHLFSSPVVSTLEGNIFLLQQLTADWTGSGGGLMAAGGLNHTKRNND